LTHPGKIKKVMLNKPSVTPVKQAIDAIYEADVIVLGPGSLYTSIIPNLLVEGVAKAIAESKAIKVYVCNIMTQPGETENYTVGDHIDAIYSHVGRPFIDICIANNGKIKPDILRKYQNDGSNPVHIDYPAIKKLGVRLIEKDLVKISKDLIRHDSNLLSKTIMELTKFD